MKNVMYEQINVSFVYFTIVDRATNVGSNTSLETREMKSISTTLMSTIPLPLFQHYTNYMRMSCSAIVRPIVSVVKFSNKSTNYQEGAAVEHPENRLRYSSDHPQTMTGVSVR